MANPTTTTPSAAVDEALRIANQNAGRTTGTAQAAVGLGRTYLDQTAKANRDLFALWTASIEVGLKTAFEFQNAALAATQPMFDTSISLSKDAFSRQAELARRAQATTLKAYQDNARLAHSLINVASE